MNYCVYCSSKKYNKRNSYIKVFSSVYRGNTYKEKFLEQFCEDAYAQCVKDRKKSLSYQHLASVVSKQKRYDFLSDFVPEKIKAEAALAESKLTEKEAGYDYMSHETLETD
ncbi:hypothetical protein Dsin_020073 [Dipteronia sinensis]|uniref:Uncharacterized protein n=1 Tax=Dipteronia sinensis TaxID=43782 RepID=A0AAE0A8I3_9ROSI|nr:hypothetical protein Dsin_020073 [Dipteronia sinensis]